MPTLTNVPGKGTNVLQGMLTEPDALAVQGMGGISVTSERDPAHKELFTKNTLRGVNHEKIRISEAAVPSNSTVTGRLRGAGNFGVFTSAVGLQSGWRLRIYTDNDRQNLVAEFEG